MELNTLHILETNNININNKQISKKTYSKTNKATKLNDVPRQLNKNEAKLNSNNFSKFYYKKNVKFRKLLNQSEFKNILKNETIFKNNKEFCDANYFLPNLCTNDNFQNNNKHKYYKNCSFDTSTIFDNTNNSFFNPLKTLTNSIFNNTFKSEYFKSFQINNYNNSKNFNNNDNIKNKTNELIGINNYNICNKYYKNSKYKNSFYNSDKLDSLSNTSITFNKKNLNKFEKKLSVKNFISNKNCYIENNDLTSKIFSDPAFLLLIIKNQYEKTKLHNYSLKNDIKLLKEMYNTSKSTTDNSSIILNSDYIELLNRYGIKNLYLSYLKDNKNKMINYIENSNKNNISNLHVTNEFINLEKEKIQKENNYSNKSIYNNYGKANEELCANKLIYNSLNGILTHKQIDKFINKIKQSHLLQLKLSLMPYVKENKIETRNVINSINKNSIKGYSATGSINNNVEDTTNINIIYNIDKVNYSREYIFTKGLVFTLSKYEYKKNKPICRFNSCITLCHDKIYLYGGLNGKRLNDIWCLTFIGGM